MTDAELMIQYIQTQNVDKAMQIFSRVKKYSSEEEKYSLADQLAHYGFLEEAIELYQSLLEKHPFVSDIKLSLSELLIEIGQEEKALLLLKEIPDTDDLYGAALLLEADLYQMQGLYEVSEQKLLAAKQKYPDEPIVVFALGELYMSQGRFLDAAMCYRQLLSKGEHAAAGQDIHAKLAEALSAGGAFEESIHFYEKALEKHQELNVLFGYGLTCYQAGNYHKAIKAFNELKQLDPDYTSLYLYLAKCHEQVHELEKAIQVGKEGLAVDEFNPDLCAHTGTLLLKAGRNDEAESYLRKALSLDPELLEAAKRLTRLLMKQERHHEVLEITAMFQDSQDAEIHWDAAYSYQQVEQYSDALNEYKLAYNDLKHNSEFLKDFGYFLVEEGKTEEAAGIFQSLAELEPWNEEWHEWIDRLKD
ncbi:tetratricopeptide repeat protein [Siminovitchia sp. 179-K 8D1 HS]|uniref:tetratricopeptide repeat protein n=1 Tax=Siminovitchia sp. 179-K 8D1 HS TaxID=3142385 RepID=UPI0039A0D7C4